MSEEKKKPDNIEKGELEEAPDSHEYDGIKELNNPAPFWIMLVFLVTICFAMIYTIHNFGYPGNKMDQTSKYNKALADFDEKQRRKMAEESGEEFQMSQEQILKAGADLYSGKGCTACHGLAGEGNAIGPNLTDKFWINGCSDEEILSVIRDGKAEKGMTPYKSMMTEEQMMHLTTYIKLTLAESGPANPKDPQGVECE